MKHILSSYWNAFLFSVVVSTSNTLVIKLVASGTKCTACCNRIRCKQDPHHFPFFSVAVSALNPLAEMRLCHVNVQFLVSAVIFGAERAFKRSGQFLACVRPDVLVEMEPVAECFVTILALMLSHPNVHLIIIIIEIF